MLVLVVVEVDLERLDPLSPAIERRAPPPRATKKNKYTACVLRSTAPSTPPPDASEGECTPRRAAGRVEYGQLL